MMYRGLNKRQELEVLTVFALLSLFVMSALLWFLIPYLYVEQGFGDRDRYLAVANTPFIFTASPWGYRIAVPWSARALSQIDGLSIERAFEVLQFLFFLSINVLIYRVCTVLGAKKGLIFLALVVFASGYQYVYYRFNYAHVGMAELSLLGWLCWWMYCRNYTLILVGLLLSILIKESIAFIFLQVLTLYWISQWVWRRPDISLIRLCVLCISPILLFVAVRLMITAPGESAAASYLGGYNTSFFNKLLGPQFPMRLVEYFTVFGCLVPAILYACKYFISDSFMRIQILVFGVAVSQLVLALDTRRMASMAMIAVLFIVVRLITKHGLAGWGYCLLGLQILFGLFWLDQFHSLAVVCLIMAAALSVGFCFQDYRVRSYAPPLRSE